VGVLTPNAVPKIRSLKVNKPLTLVIVLYSGKFGHGAIEFKLLEKCLHKFF
jgi:hypothetical protein